MKKYIVCLLLFVTSMAQADKLTIHNETAGAVAVRLYLKKGDRADAVGSVEMIPSGGTGLFDRPARKLFYDREIRFVDASQKHTLSTILLDSARGHIPFQNVGLLEGSVYHIVKETNGVLRAYSDSLWNKLTSPLNEWKKRVEREGLKAVEKNSYQGVPAAVRSGGICPQEFEFIQKRISTVKKACTSLQLLADDDATIPLIAVIMSGGGYRAATAAAGSLAGLKDTGLLDTVLWIVGLSGSSWYLASWYTSGLDAILFLPYLQQGFSKHLLDINETGANQIVNAIAVQQYFKQEVTFIDIYGALLAEKLFWGKSNPEHKRLSHIAPLLEKNPEKWPFPICTAIYQSVSRAIPGSLWYEMTPYEVGAIDDGLFIPTWSFGRTFQNGQSINFVPEKSLGFLCGMWGSAFAATFGLIYDTFMKDAKNTWYGKMVRIIPESVLSDTAVATLRGKRTKDSWALVPNPTYGMAQSRVGTSVDIKLTDAGIDFNVPLPPVGGWYTGTKGRGAGRKPDMLIIFDYSDGCCADLRKAEDYARTYNLPFPKIDYDGIDARSMTIFEDLTQSDIPTVVYMPLVKDSNIDPSFDPSRCMKTSFCATSNFSYKPADFATLSAYTRHAIIKNKDKLVAALGRVLEKKKVNSIDDTAG